MYIVARILLFRQKPSDDASQGRECSTRERCGGGALLPSMLTMARKDHRGRNKRQRHLHTYRASDTTFGSHLQILVHVNLFTPEDHPVSTYTDTARHFSLYLFLSYRRNFFILRCRRVGGVFKGFCCCLPHVMDIIFHGIRKQSTIVAFGMVAVWYLTEMLVSFLRDVLTTQVTDVDATRTRHFVATIDFEERGLAFRTFPDTCIT